ncbi:MAG: hypothetical protein F4070_04745, partial [Acidimicrobiales bacterium]|nr:hypothetical protein [Acidimicrobiales bacterium]
ELDFLQAHRVEALWGVGPVTLRRLNKIDVYTVGDLAAVPLNRLVSTVGAAHGVHLATLAQGIDDRPVHRGGLPRSVSHEQTFETDLTGAERVRGEAVRLADAVASRLRANGLSGRTVTVKIKHPDFSLRTRARTLPEPIQTGHALAHVAQQLIGTLDLHSGIRLLGVAVSNLEETASAEMEPATRSLDESEAASAQPHQMALDLDPLPDAATERDDETIQGPTGDTELDLRLADALDAIRNRFGRSVIAHGSAALRDGTPGERRWGR